MKRYNINYDIYIGDNVYKYKTKLKGTKRFKKPFVGVNDLKEKLRYLRWKKFAYVFNGINKDYQNKLKKEKLKDNILDEAIINDSNLIIKYIENSNDDTKVLLLANLIDEIKLEKDGIPLNKKSNEIYKIMEHFDEYIPEIKDEGDTSNFSEYPDSPEPSPSVSKDEDPFKDW
jgi:superfamily I DNA/RNA helicase